MVPIIGSIARVSELADAEREYAATLARGRELSIMGTPELHGAVAAVRHAAEVAADGLLRYHVAMREASRDLLIAQERLRELRAAHGLPPPERPTGIAPDFGPMPTRDPGTNVITGKGRTWTLLLGSLNGSDLETIARCLGELNGWTPAEAAAPG